MFSFLLGKYAQSSIAGAQGTCFRFQETAAQFSMAVAQPRIHPGREQCTAAPSSLATGGGVLMWPSWDWWHLPAGHLSLTSTNAGHQTMAFVPAAPS